MLPLAVLGSLSCAVLIQAVQLHHSAARPDAWFDQPPAQLRAHATQCGAIGTGGARMEGCHVQLGSQPTECVYVPEKAADPAAALKFLGLRKSGSANAPAGRPETAQLEAMPSGSMGWVCERHDEIGRGFGFDLDWLTQTYMPEVETGALKPRLVPTMAYFVSETARPATLGGCVCIATSSHLRATISLARPSPASYLAFCNPFRARKHVSSLRPPTFSRWVGQPLGLEVQRLQRGDEERKPLREERQRHRQRHPQCHDSILRAQTGRLDASPITPVS